MPKSRNRQKKSNGSVGTSMKNEFEIYYFNKENKVQRACMYKGTMKDACSIGMKHLFSEFDYLVIIENNKIVFRSKALNYTQTDKVCIEIFNYRNDEEFVLITKKNVKDRLRLIKKNVFDLIKHFKNKCDLDMVEINILPDLAQYLIDNNYSVEGFKNELINNLNVSSDVSNIN